MKNFIQKIKENYGLVIVVLIVGLLLGWLISPSGEAPSSTETAVHEDHDHESEAETWTCSMHPQIRMDHPGKCPICSMDLIPLSSMQSDEETANPNDIVMTESAAKLAAVQTIVVGKGAAEKQIYLQGKVQADERNLAEMTARFGGRIEKLFVNFTGQHVRKGEKLATIYSPDLITAQRELLEATKLKDSRPSLYKASREKLKLWDLTEDQISSIEKAGEPKTYFDILATISGTVMARHVAVGDYVKKGEPLFQLINLSQVWILFDAYESDLPWLRVGDPVNFTVQALPGKEFNGKISYIDPFMSGSSRVAKVRVVVSNPQQSLKPEMFVNGIVESDKAEKSNELLIPKSAVLWTGKRSVVYVKVPNTTNPTFSFREIELGPETGNYYVVANGLNEGEEVAVNGVFKIDAAAQLQGLPSMMNPQGEESEAGQMPGMDMPKTNSTTEHAMFKVSGNCDMCKDRIETAANRIDGVLSANWDPDKQMLHLNFDPKKTSTDEVQKAVAAAGHDTEKYKAPDSVYNELPECCLYRDESHD
ncbi:efflux RND transporter periplasmic adaptor subunit [Mangrovibacterium diazotrophicum]|uniref:Cu(I)/Ag(I) efflux system membrane fusion protein n=1 Tax=Mangrovibacterium diazotrophicum TaxID=1261403 RepID=A0A419VWJ4_9BACT|nr:efflux RND transporter periplasmic adaptor subunit [Mangrovibacterium diazotrophicum]RKD86529.1 Cu(I)/Ag(I) efflux system membrane fusion protein [Mangrovibacterium diazotrophicum]